MPRQLLIEPPIMSFPLLVAAFSRILLKLTNEIHRFSLILLLDSQSSQFFQIKL